ncbi:MAG: GWxTD domain-containing protein [Bacteroidota bacterium]
MNRRLILIQMMMSALVWSVGFSQRFAGRPDRDENSLLYEQSRPVYFETLNLMSSDSGKSRLDVSFRIASDFFVFVRDTSLHPSFPFAARGDITVEILDSDKVSVARELLTKDFHAPGPPAPNSGRNTVEGVFSFNLPPATYTIVTEAKDRESDRRYFDDNKKVTLKDFSRHSLELSDVVFVDTVKGPADSSAVLKPLNLGGSVFFGNDWEGYVELAGMFPRESFLVAFRIFRLGPEKGKRVQLIADSIPPYRISEARSLSVEQEEDGYFYNARRSNRPGKHCVFLNFRGDTLAQGSYEMEITARSGSDTASSTKHFQVSWVGMPRSLMNLDIAVDALEYIMTADEFKSIKDAGAENRRTLFEEFWKKHDPTPGTAYNEAMAEYYRRVDHAMTAFATVHEPIGMKTERGRAYILYGPPTHTDRALLPKEPPKEIWYYETLGKKLIFTDENRNGNYKLIAEEQLPKAK